MLDHKKLQEDVDRIAAFYYDHGYLNVHISEPTITRNPKGLTLVINVDEGPLYKVGAVELTGDLKYPRSELTPLLTIKAGDQFRVCLRKKTEFLPHIGVLLKITVESYFRYHVVLNRFRIQISAFFTYEFWSLIAPCNFL